MAEILVATTVVNFHAVKHHWDKVERVWDDNRYKYIGRYNVSYHLEGSRWSNPYHISIMNRVEAIEAYRRYVHKQLLEGTLDLAELRGKMLVCWCKPLACHGDVLLELLNEKYG